MKLYPENPNPKDLEKIVETLRAGGTIIYPTDTLYGIGCDAFDGEAVASTIVDLTGERPLVLREGAVPAEEIAEVLAVGVDDLRAAR